MAGNIEDGPWNVEAASDELVEAAFDELAAVDELPLVGIAMAAIELAADPPLIRMYGTAEVVAELALAEWAPAE